MDKRVQIALIIAAAVIVASLILRPSFERLGEFDSKVKMALDLLERIEPLVGSNTKDLDALVQQLDKHQSFFDDLNLILSKTQKQVDDIGKKIDTLPDYEVPDVGDVEPEDYEECLEELSDCREAANDMLAIIGRLENEVALRRGLQASQGIIIETQEKYIVQRDVDYQALRDMYDEVLRTARRERRIAIGGAMIYVAYRILK